MWRMICYNLWLVIKKYVFWMSIGISACVCYMMAYTDISLHVSSNLLYFLYVGISASVSMSLLVIISSFSTIQAYVHDVQSGHQLFLKLRLGNIRYYTQLYMTNCLSSFLVGVSMVLLFSLILSWKYSLFGEIISNVIESIAGGHLLLNHGPIWTYLYFVWIVGVAFAFFQLLATFLTVLFPHSTMCYLYACLCWLICQHLPFFEEMPFYLSPVKVFATDNTFYELSRAYNYPLSLWYPPLYFVVTFFLILMLTILFDKLKHCIK